MPDEPFAGRALHFIGIGGAVIGAVVVMMRVDPGIVIFPAQPLFLGGMLGLFAKQGVAVGLGDLVIIGVDFAEREEPVPVAAIIDEGRLQRRLDPSDLG